MSRPTPNQINEKKAAGRLLSSAQIRNMGFTASDFSLTPLEPPAPIIRGGIVTAPRGPPTVSSAAVPQVISNQQHSGPSDRSHARKRCQVLITAEALQRLELSSSMFDALLTTDRASFAAGPSQAASLPTAPSATVVEVNSGEQQAGPSRNSLRRKRSKDKSPSNTREITEQVLQKLNLSPSIFDRLARSGTSAPAVDPMDVDNLSCKAPVPSQSKGLALGDFRIPPAAFNGYLPADFKLPPSQSSQVVSHKAGNAREPGDARAVGNAREPGRRNVRWASSPVKYRHTKSPVHELPGDSSSPGSIHSDSSELPGSGSPVISEEGDISERGEHSGRRSFPIYIRSSSVTRDVDPQDPVLVDVDEDMEIEGQELDEFTDVQGQGAGGRMEEVAHPDRAVTWRSTVLQGIDDRIPPGRLRNMAVAFHEELQEENRRLQDLRELQVLQRRALQNVRSLSRKLRMRMERIEDS